MPKKIPPLELSKRLAPFVQPLLWSMAIAQTEREKADKIQRQILAEDEYVVGAIDIGNLGERITDPKLVYLIDEVPLRVYHDKLDAGYRAAGYDLPKDHCPALCAEHAQTKYEWALLEAANDYFFDEPGRWEELHGDLREKMLDLLIKFVVNAPGYQNPNPKTMPTPLAIITHTAPGLVSA